MSEFKYIDVLGEKIAVKDETAREELKTKIGWTDTNKIRNITFEKIVDSGVVVPSDYITQGFALDSNYYYIYSYKESVNGVLRKIRRSDNVQVASVVTSVWHGNNITLTPDGTKLLLTYNTNPDGENVQTVGVFNTSNLSFVGSFETGNVTYACGLINKDGIETLIYAISNSRALGVKVKVNDTDYALTEFITLEDGPSGLKQGMHLGSYIYMLESYYGITKNVIRVYDYSGVSMISLYPNIDTEIEDISRVSGEERLYIIDSTGAIYKSEPTDGFFHIPFIDSLNSNYVKCTPRIMSNSLWNEVESYTSADGTKSIPYRLKCNPAFKRITNQMVVGTCKIDSSYYPVVYNPQTGSLSIKGNKVVGFNQSGVGFVRTNNYDVTYTYNESASEFILEHCRYMYTQLKPSDNTISCGYYGLSGETLQAQATQFMDGCSSDVELVILQSLVGANYGVAVNHIP